MTVQKNDIQSFFYEISPRLEVAQKIDQEMNRIFAYRFNALDYVRTDELGLSRIIADLLDPNARHGQGSLFLEILLSKLNLLQEENDNSEFWTNIDFERVNVVTERKIKDDRRIDIYIELNQLGSDNGVYCLAIENKPYAGDSHNQVSDYLSHLEDKSQVNKYLLIYLSPNGTPPSSASLPETEYDRWTNKFKIMSYCEKVDTTESDAEEDTDVNVANNHDFNDYNEQLDAFAIEFSLVDWLGTCKEKCDIDRLRSFLSDIQQFCETRFGGKSMGNDSEIQVANDFLDSETRHLEVAKIVTKSYEELRDQICEKFFFILIDKIKNRFNEIELDTDDFKFVANYGKTTFKNNIYIFKESWKPCSASGSKSETPLNIIMQNQWSGPRGWIVGITWGRENSDMNDKERELSKKIENALGV